MQIGFVGKPNIGKSTFFKAATLANVLIANYPFATIKPNHGTGYVKILKGAKEFGKNDNPREGYVIGDFRFVPIDLMDVAGLVPGAYKGEGMGNQFLDDLRQADILVHVIDASGGTSAKGEVIQSGTYDPAEDIKFLEVELDMWYFGIIQKGWDKFAKTIQNTHSKASIAIAKQLSGLGVKEAMILNAMTKLKLDPENVAKWTEEDLMKMATYLREITKPIIIAANKCDISFGRENLEKLKAQFPNYKIVPTSAESELALREASRAGLINYVPGEKTFDITPAGEQKLNQAQKNALNFIKDNVLTLEYGTGVQQILNIAVFDILKYVAIFPGGLAKLEDSKGNVLPDCFLMPPGTTALGFAFRLHTDFGNNFVKATDVRTRIPIGKDHVLKNRDILEIHANK